MGVDKKHSQLYSTLPGAHTQNQAEVNVLAAARNILVAKLSNNFEKLLEMEILSTCHNINHVVKLVFLILSKAVSNLVAAGWDSIIHWRMASIEFTYSAEKFADITGEVQSSTIPLSIVPKTLVMS